MKGMNPAAFRRELFKRVDILCFASYIGHQSTSLYKSAMPGTLKTAGLVRRGGFIRI